MGHSWAVGWSVSLNSANVGSNAAVPFNSSHDDGTALSCPVASLVMVVKEGHEIVRNSRAVTAPEKARFCPNAKIASANACPC